MRSFFFPLLAAAATLCASAAPSVAQTNAPSVTNTPVEESAEQHYRDAVALLRNGRKFETAISKLRNAVEQKPENGAYRLALGCALTSRAVSIADAARQAAEYPGRVSDYKDAVVLWEAARKQSNSVLYNQDRPLPPAVPATKDDGVVYNASREKAEQFYNDLGKEALQEWEESLRTAKTDDEKAQAQFLTGWGKSLLRVGNFDLKLSADLQKEVAPQKCADAVQSATALAPNDAALWRGLGDVALFEYYADKGDADMPYNKKAAQAYERSVALNKKTLDLWYVLFLMESRHDIARADTALNHALRLDSGNAFLWYEKAYFIPHRIFGTLTVEAELDEAKKMTAVQWLSVLTAVERGNATGRFEFVGVSPQPPALLASAWRQCAHDKSLPMYRVVLTNLYLSTIFSENIDAAKKLNDSKRVERWSRAAIGMGQLMSRDVISGEVSPVSPFASTSLGLLATEGKFAIQQGYGGLIALQNPGSEAARALRQEKQRMTEIIDGWSKAYLDAHKSPFNRTNEP